MFLAVVIPLVARNTLAAGENHFLGREAHALFLHLVEQVDAARSEQLHRAEPIKPFTVSSVFDARRNRLPMIREGERYAWRFTIFDPELARWARDALLPALPKQVRLGSALFDVCEPVMERTKHPWAGTSSAEELVEKWFDKNSPPLVEPALSVPKGEGEGEGKRMRSKVTLEFASPTAHRQIHRNVLFPQPAQLWGGWLRAWNAYAQPAFEEDLIPRVESDVAVSNYTLQTEVVDFGDFRERGWGGRATFNYFSQERALWRVLNLLADFAFFCGTGYKTTQGMGQTRRIGNEERRTLASQTHLP